MKSSAAKIQIAAFDDLFPGEDTGGTGQILELPLADLHTFRNHPFHVLDDEKMQETVDSVAKYGVLVPGIARPRPAGGYELVAGHRRKHASERVGKDTMPVIVRDMDDDEATIIMVDTNIQRENLLPSEKAFAYQMKVEALKRQGERTDLTSARDVPKRLTAREQVAQDAGEKSGMAVTRYIALTKLLPELLDMVDAGTFSVSAAADYIADLPQTAQGWLLEVMGRLDCTPTAPQLARIKKYQQEDKLDVNVIDAILTEERPAPVKVTIKGERLKQYFPKEYTQIQVEEVIFSLLETWKVQQS